MLTGDLFHSLCLLLFSHLPSIPFFSREILGIGDSSNNIQANCKGVKIVYCSPLFYPEPTSSSEGQNNHINLLLLAPFANLCFSIQLKTLLKTAGNFKIFQRFSRRWTEGKARHQPKNPFIKINFVFNILCPVFNILSSMPDYVLVIQVFMKKWQ